VTNYVAQHEINEGTYPSLAVLVRDVAGQVSQYGSLAKFPADAVGNTRNDMYLVSEAIRNLMKDKESSLDEHESATLNAYKGSLDNATKFIPIWVKIAVAIALGLGTMIGWKRIVVTVGEKIGKNASYLCSGRLRRDHSGGNHSRRRSLWTAGFDNPRALVRHRWYDGSERFWATVVDGWQHRAGLGIDVTRRHADLG
jgi:hypothetical protein